MTQAMTCKWIDIPTTSNCFGYLFQNDLSFLNIQYFTPVNKFPSKNFKKESENFQNGPHFKKSLESFRTERFRQNTRFLWYVVYAL